MRKIADTAFGRNALVAGLISHAAAILAGMLSASGGDAFFTIVYPVSCLFLLAGAFRELTHRERRPLASVRFYLIAAVSPIPLLGPLTVLGILYRDRAGQNGLSGFISAILNLRAHILVVFGLLILLFLLFAVLGSRNDPYFRKHRQAIAPTVIADRTGGDPGRPSPEVR